jgi:hypothetical protein
MISVKQIPVTPEIECSCCYALAEYIFTSKDENDDVIHSFSCANPLCYDDAEAMVSNNHLED